MKIVHCWLAVLFISALLSPRARAEERFALLIGANAGWAQDRPLRYAEADAERLRATLVELGGFAPERVVLLRDPDTEVVRAHLRRLTEALQALEGSSFLLFYYSGHADERRLHLRGPALSHDELYARLEALPATVRLAVVDACRSGSLLASKGGQPAASFQLRVKDELAVHGLAVLTSSGADELAQETRALAGSVFTHHLISGLRGAADVDESRSVTLAEAYRHAHERTTADTAASAAPHRPTSLLQLQGQGELVLTWLDKAQAGLVLPAGEQRRYVVVDERELRLVAEGSTADGREVVLALAPGRYRLKRPGEREVEVADLTLAPGQQVAAGALRYESRPLEAGLLKGQPEQMDDEELHQWKRSEALRLLAAGEPDPALRLLDELLERQPGDLGALRGRARALLRQAELRGREGALAEESALMHLALLADPSLVEDAGFVRRYRQLGDGKAAELRAGHVREDVRQELIDRPRLARRWSLGVDVLGSRGLLAVVGSVLLGEVWLVHAAIEPLGAIAVGLPSLDVGGRRLFPLAGRFETYVGAGLHLSRAPWPGSWDGDPLFRQRLLYRLVWGNAVHLDAGLQYVFDVGLALELGAAFVLTFPHVTDVPLLSLGVSWWF